MICKKCGAQAGEGELICSSCGEPLDYEEIVNEEETVEVQEEELSFAETEETVEVQAENESSAEFQDDIPTVDMPNFALELEDEVPFYEEKNDYDEPLSVQEDEKKNFFTNVVTQFKGVIEKLGPKKVKIIAGILAAAILIVTFIALFAGNSPKGAANLYMDAKVNYNYNKLVKSSAFNIKNLYKEIFEKMGVTEKEFETELRKNEDAGSVKELYENQEKSVSKAYRNQYGSNYKISYQITNVEKLSKNDVQAKVDSLHSMFDSLLGISPDKIIKLDKIKQMAEVEFEISITGKKDESIHMQTVTCVKVGSRWKVLDAISDFNFLY